LSDETENNTVKETAEDEAAAVVPTSDPLSLEKEPPGSSSNKGAVPLILSRQSHPTDYESHAQLLSESLAMAALEEEEQENEARQHKEQDAEQPKEATQGGRGSGKVFAVDPELLSGKKKRSKKKKKSKQREAVPEDKEEEPSAEIEPVSATDALKALPAQEVSITATTQVKILRNESSVSLSNRSDATPTKIIPDGPKSKKKSKKKGGKGLSSDDKANQRAARKFNNEVRLCVERSDPDSMREILQDRRNHKFALDHMVLETVMKAYIMAAMFEDALYCLRNCVLPGTLSTLQTERILTCLPQNLRSSNAYTAADMINALCIATQFDAPTHLTYFLRIVRGIALEFLEEAMSARDRICSAPCERLVRSGLCVVDARLKRGKKPADLLVIPGDQLGVWQAETVDNRGIQAGDAVSILPYAGPYPLSAESLDRNMIEATVTNTQPMVLRLQDKANANLHAFLTEEAEGNVYRIDKLANRMGFNRQLSAAVAIASPMGDSPVRDTRRPCPQLIKAITAMDENIDINLVMHKEEVSSAKGGTLAAIAANSKTTTAAICAQAIPWNVADESDDMDQDAMRHASRLALEKYGALEGLNASQQLAVEGAVTNRLTLIQGPPGSGKTEICIRILQHWARLNAANAEKGETPSPIVATSDSNIAVDNLVEGCANVGLRVVRLGRPEAIRPELLRYCIDRPPSSYDKSNGNGASASYYGSSSSSAASYKERMKQLKNAQVVCCTCIGSGGDILDSLGPLDRILVDEATQATEPAVLVPLMRGCRQLVLVGDHCQLPPTVLSTRAEEEGHGVPLFSRLVACGVPPYMLDTQYRMHPCIAMFPSDLFYGGLLKTGVSAPERRPLAGFPWPREEFPVAFIPVKGVEMDDGVSKFNEAEAAAACEAVTFLLQGGQCTVSDIAVVTPYAAQARLIRRMTRRLTNATGPPYIEVSSVDGFQGREKEAVVFSAVRSNDYGAIGFTSDWRRINVSFTRARRALIVIGNDQTLRRGDPETWMPWLAWADAHGLNMDKPGVPRGRYEPEQLRRVRGGTTAAEMLKDVLARQQEQVKDAERQQERAVKNAEGHILAAADDEEGGGTSTPKQLTLEEDVALLEKAEGNWDDSDDDWEDKPMVHSASRNTLTSATSSNLASGVESESSAADVWDL
jgi:regulator of nonsense transcripts 1